MKFKIFILLTIFLLLTAMILIAESGWIISRSNNLNAGAGTVKIREQSSRPQPNNKILQNVLITNKVTQMTLDEKIGQLLIVGFEHGYVDEHIQTMITKYHVGGVNLLKRNVKDRNQTKNLTRNLQAISTIPLFIATDQEGGKVSRFHFLKQLTPQIKIKDEVEAEKIAFERAAELKDLGMNVNFSPVLDYVSNPNSYLYSRTFGTSVEEIAKLGEAMILGYRRGGIIPVAKHFPGYGNIILDPHSNSSTLFIDSEEFRENLNLVPFEKISRGNATLAIMTAHILIPSIDTKPATISSRFLKEILRKQLGFKGVIMTDDIEMAAAGKQVEKIAVEAIEAGADMIISTYTPEKQIRIFEAIKTAVLGGKIPEKRIDESVVRILKLKFLLQ